ncbi:MAG: hypothetical protein ACP5MC_02215 [Candidatus Micrarchaeia archaeon]
MLKNRKANIEQGIMFLEQGALSLEQGIASAIKNVSSFFFFDERWEDFLDPISFEKVNFYYSWVSKRKGRKLGMTYLKSKQLGDILFEKYMKQDSQTLIDKANAQLEEIKKASYLPNLVQVIEEIQKRYEELQNLLKQNDLEKIAEEGKDIESAYDEALDIAAQLNRKLNKKYDEQAGIREALVRIKRGVAGAIQKHEPDPLLQKIDNTVSFADSLGQITGISLDKRFLIAEHTVFFASIYERESEWAHFLNKAREKLESEKRYNSIASTPIWDFVWLYLKVYGISAFSGRRDSVSKEISTLSGSLVNGYLQRKGLEELLEGKSLQLERQDGTELKESLQNAIMEVYKNDGSKIAKKLIAEIQSAARKAAL